MKRYRMMAAALCAVVLLCGFSTTAYAGGGDEAEQWEGLDPVETAEPGEGFSEDGGLVTCDLLYDKHTNKQFITVQASGGSTFYIVIDYDKPVSEEEEQYQTYFLNTVDEADLLAAIEAAGGELPVCACSEKCAAGAVNTDCPVCATNMTECAGVTPEPVDDPEPAEEPEPDEDKGGGAGTLLLVVAVLAVGGGAGWYFKIYRPKKERAADSEEEEYGGEDYGDLYGDGEAVDYEDGGFPWDEDEGDGGV